MNDLAERVLSVLQGRTLVTAESCTGGWIGKALTAIPGSSDVFKGGIICYANWVKENVLSVTKDALEQYGAVSENVAMQMANGARNLLKADIAVSVTGLAGPGADAYGNEIGTVYIGYCDSQISLVKAYCFKGDRESVRLQAVEAALELILQLNK
jgi:nicotinamide-nucleotide amidase